MERSKIKELQNWLKSPRRKPLIVWGARQVGKTYLVRDIFAKQYFKDYVFIDLKKDDQARAFFATTSDSDKYITYIEARFGKKLTPKTLLIFDEVQQCHQVLSSLKYFCQDHREIPVIATGSLVRLSIKQQEQKNKDDDFLFPVGKIDSLNLYPVTFEEYLMNVNPVLLEMITDAYSKKQALEQVYHEMAMDLLHQYLTIGGLPEPLDIFIQDNSYVDATKVLKEVYSNYLGDMDTYNVSNETILKTRNVYKNIFSQLNKENKNFKISLLEKGKSNRDYFSAYEWLELARVVYRCHNVKAHIPLPLQEESSGLFRLYLADEGIFTYQSQVNQADFFVKDRRNTLSGIFYENYTACEFAAKEIPLFYWTGKQTHEIEFVVYSGGKLYPIDVKKKKGSLGSLQEFRELNGKCTAIKISANNFGYNAEQDILTIPHYAVFALAEDLASGTIAAVF
ncbi:MAG: AAA family ATPase [Treponemataceae bacterium]|nr:AAA family ATPase [Treponemataceae bacterium]